jgi:hypothetical protein
MSQTEREVDLESLELSIAQAKKLIARMEALERLQQNPDFVELIEKGFMESHAIRQVMLKAHPSLQDEKQQKLLDAQIGAIGNFRQFLIAIYTEGRNAQAALEADEQTREDILAEDLTNA